jgi:hypothetical protein
MYSAFIDGLVTFRENANIAEKKKVVNIVRQSFRNVQTMFFKEFFDLDDSYRFRALMEGPVDPELGTKFKESIGEGVEKLLEETRKCVESFSCDVYIYVLDSMSEVWYSKHQRDFRANP